MKRPTKAQLREQAQDRRAIALSPETDAAIAKRLREGVPPQPVPHVIQIPIWRAVIVGERLTAATDVKAGTWGIEQIPRDLVNTVFNGQYLYLRRITTVDLTVFTHK